MLFSHSPPRMGPSQPCPGATVNFPCDLSWSLLLTCHIYEEHVPWARIEYTTFSLHLEMVQSLSCPPGVSDVRGAVLHPGIPKEEGSAPVSSCTSGSLVFVANGASWPEVAPSQCQEP